MVSEGGGEKGHSRAQLQDEAAGGSEQRPAGGSLHSQVAPAVKTAVDGWRPRPSMKAPGLGLCAFALLAGLVGSVCPRALPGWGPGPAPAAPQNSSGGAVASPGGLSVRAPFLITLWTLVALSSLMGKCPRRFVCVRSVCGASF